MYFKGFIAIILFLFCQSPWASERALCSSVQVPEAYEELKKKIKEDDKLIPDKAQNAESAGAFASTVLDFHWQKYLSKNPNSSLHKIKKMESSLNESTSVETESLKVKPKLNLAQMKAEVDIETFLNSRLILDDGFRTFNAEVDLYEIQEGRLGLEYKSDSTESRTLLGYKKTW